MSSVIIAENLRVFEEFTFREALFELVPRDEKILLAVHFLSARGSRRIGDGKAKIGNSLDQPVCQGGFSGARRGGNNEDGGHSRFRDCSRTFSMAAFAPSASSVIFRPASPAPLVFERIVLVSRFISWSRKSSFLPTSPPASSRPFNCAAWIFRRASSSPMSLRSA